MLSAVYGLSSADSHPFQIRPLYTDSADHGELNDMLLGLTTTGFAAERSHSKMPLFYIFQYCGLRGPKQPLMKRSDEHSMMELVKGCNYVSDAYPSFSSLMNG